MRLGISSFTFGWAVGVPGHEPAQPLDEHGLLDKANELGVRLLQIGDNLPLHEFDEARLSRLAERAAHDGIELEVGARRLTRDRVSDYARIARRLNAKLVRFVIDDTSYHPAPDDVITLLRQCVPLLDGLTFGIENHDRFPALTLLNIIQNVNSERVGICLDTANSLGAGEGIEYVTGVLSPVTVNLHIKDFQIARVFHKMGFTVTGAPAGEGMLDVPRLLKAFDAAPRCHTAVLELWTPPEQRLEDTISKEADWAETSIRYLEPFFTA